MSDIPTCVDCRAETSPGVTLCRRCAEERRLGDLADEYIDEQPSIDEERRSDLELVEIGL